MKKVNKQENTVTIGPKYQVVIPKALRNKHSQFTKGTKVKLYSLDDKTLAIAVEDKNWAEENRGIFKDLWKGIDIEKELRKLRDEWD